MSGERIVFLADAHLQPGEQPEQNHMLERFLREACAQADKLVLLGDLFHCWFERGGRVVGDFSGLLEHFGNAAGRGLAIHYVTGNRDFAVGAGSSEHDSGWTVNPRFAGFYSIVGNSARSVLTGYGIEPHGIYYRLRAQGMNLACVHGDVYCAGEHVYLFMRWLTQGPLGRVCMSLGPFWLARLIVGWFQNRPVSRRRHYPARGHGIAWSRVCAELGAGADLVVCGHLHHAGMRPLVNGRRKGKLVLVGAWCAGYEYAVLEAGEMRLLTFARGLPEDGQSLGLRR